MTQSQIDRIRRAHELAAEACGELVRAHLEPGPPAAAVPAIQGASGELSAICAALSAILTRHDEAAKTEAWRQRLFEQNHGARE